MKTLHNLVAILLLAALLGGNRIAAAEAWASPQGNLFNMQLIGQSGGAGWAVAVNGNVVYAGMGLRLLALDVSSPAAPVLLDESNLFTDIVSDIAIVNGLAYVAARTAGLQIVNISNPQALVNVGELDTPGWANGVAVADGYAYVADSGEGLRIVNVSNPASPVEVASVPSILNTFDVAVSGSYAYVTESNNGLYVYDVSDPTSPTLVGYLGSWSGDPVGDMRDITVVGDYAYITEYDKGLRVVDISDPAHPATVDAMGIAVGAYYKLAVAGNYVYLGNQMELGILDVSNPADIKLIGSLEMPGESCAVAARGSTAYVATWTTGLYMVDVADPANPVLIGAYQETADAIDLAVSGNHALVAEWYRGLHLVDFSNPFSPRDAGFAAVENNVDGVAVSGRYAYIASGDLYIVDISNPEAPIQVGVYDIPGVGGAVDLDISGNYLYAASLGSGLVILDLSNPTAPAPVSVVSLNARDVTVVGNLAYVTLGSALVILDITDPSAPAQLGSIGSPGGNVESAAVYGDYAYLAIWSGNLGALAIVDISDPSAPVQRGIAATAAAKGVAANRNYAYLGASDGLHVFDVSDPTAPVEVAYFKLTGGVNDIALRSNYILGAFRYNGGLIILRYGEPPPTTPSFLPMILR